MNHTTRNLCLLMASIFIGILFLQTVIGTSIHVIGQEMLSSITGGKQGQITGQNHQYVPRNITTQNIPGQQQDVGTCISKSMDKMLNGYLNFSNPDPISQQFSKNNINNGNGTNNSGGGNNNNLNNNPSFSYV